MTFVGTLYPFQEDAKDRMVDRGQMLLAMVMGAGKTPTTLSAIETLFDTNEIERVFVIVPSSLKYQWMREIKKFTTLVLLLLTGLPKNVRRYGVLPLTVTTQLLIPNYLLKTKRTF